ncbi:hypothetical protein KBB25_00595, partial [Candidatus Gracilibacteria bacterium]|nr:hypothetical protein [Candidatus Gracilibacteria bacterium]
DTALFKANLKALGLDETQIKKIEEAMITGKFDENYLRTDVNGIAIFKRIMENQGSGKGGSTGASAGATNTVNNFNIASTTKAPNTITTTDASEIQIITNGIKNHFGSETTTKKDDLISKLKTSGLNDAVINTIITSLGGSYFK